MDEGIAVVSKETVVEETNVWFYRLIWFGHCKEIQVLMFGALALPFITLNWIIVFVVTLGWCLKHQHSNLFTDWPNYLLLTLLNDKTKHCMHLKLLINWDTLRIYVMIVYRPLCNCLISLKEAVLCYKVNNCVKKLWGFIWELYKFRSKDIQIKQIKQIMQQFLKKSVPNPRKVIRNS